MDRERIAEGRTAEVFAWSDGRVLKLYRAGFGRDGAAKEFRVARLVSNAGLAAPAVYDAGSPDGVLEQDGRCGILAERIDGVSMLREMARRPWRLAGGAGCGAGWNNGNLNTGRVYDVGGAICSLFGVTTAFAAANTANRSIVWSDMSASDVVNHAYPTLAGGNVASASGTYDWTNGYLLKLNTLASQTLSH